MNLRMKIPHYANTTICNESELILKFLHSNVILYRYSKFQSVGNITLHFPDNFGGDTTQIHYIGLKGEATQVIFFLTNFAVLLIPFYFLHITDYSDSRTILCS